MKLAYLRTRLLYVLIIVWVSISVLSVFYNTFKIYPEVKNWLYLSDSEKKTKIFGDIYTFLIFVGSNTEINSTILIYSEDVKTFYLGIYNLYPRKITVVNNKAEFNLFLKETNFDYAAVFNNEFTPKGYSLISKQKLGSIYKK